MKKTLLLILLASCIPLVCRAANPPAGPRHLVRVGWGDATFETAAFHPGPAHTFGNPSAIPSGYEVLETSAYKYTGHIFADYRYRLTRVVSLGAQVDFEGISWTEQLMDRGHNPLSTARVKNYDLTFLANVRFTYFEKEWVRLYSGVGLGVTMATDNSRNTEFGPALDLNLVGVQVGKGHWSGSLDIGFLSALKNTNRIYMVGSRLVSVGINYTW